MRPEPNIPGPRPWERGWALASVLWAVTMLSLMAAATQELTLTSHRTERRAWNRACADAALHAAITQAILGITAPTRDQRWRVDGTSREVTFGGFRLKVSVQAESGRYDLNAVDASVLTTLLRSQDVDPDRATALTDSILDWRSPTGLHRLNGATNDEYAAAGLPYRPRHAAFQSVDELQLVLGMTPALFKRIRPALTVYTKRTMIDPALAPKEALLALYNRNADEVDAVLKARDQAGDMSQAIYASSHQSIINPGISLAGQAFDISAATWIEGRDYALEVVAVLTGSNQPAFITLSRRATPE